MDYYRDLARDFARDSSFRYYLAFRILAGLGTAVFIFCAVEAVKVHGMNKAFVIFVLMLGRNAARMGGAWLAPQFAERIGYKRLIFFSSIVMLAAALVAGFAPVGWGGLFLAGALTASFGGSARAVGFQSYRLRLLPRGKRVGYQAMLGSAVAITAIVAMPMMGAIMQNYGHTFGFYIGAVITGASCLPLLRCHVRDRAAGAEA
jgi:MFS family permease